MFIPEERLMSIDGKVLKQFERAVIKVIAENPLKDLSLKEGKTQPLSSPEKQ